MPKRTPWIFIPPFFYIPWFAGLHLLVLVAGAGFVFWFFRSSSSDLSLALFGVFVLFEIYYRLARSILAPQYQAFLLDTWQDRKTRWLRVEEQFELVPGEKIILPLTACFIQNQSWLSMEYYPRDVMVTNRRILHGFLLLNIKETFGHRNFWHREMKEIPSAAFNMLGANIRIEKIEYDKDERMGPYVRVKLAYFIPTTFTIYHPQARRIYEIFSQSVQ